MIKISKWTFLMFILFTSGLSMKAQNYQVTFAIDNTSDLPDSILVKNYTRNLDTILQGGDILNLLAPTNPSSAVSSTDLNKQSINIFPNPMTEFATVGFYNSLQGNVTLEVYSIDGRKILNNSQYLAKGNRSLVLSGLNKGIYIVHINTLESKSSAVIIANANSELQPNIEWLATDNQSAFNQQKATQATVVMTYENSETLNFTAYYNNTTRSKSAIITGNTSISFNFDPEPVATYPSDVFDFYNEWKITLGTGSEVKDLIDYEHEDFFYSTYDGDINWVVYKTPNQGGTTANSSNTRSELRHNLPSWLDNPNNDSQVEWTPEIGGKLTGTCKVMHVSDSADARVPASFSVVVGQIHSSEGNENEPIKIFYKKFPGHTKGSVFWNYEINTDGDNSERWDYSTPIWGNDWSVVGSTPSTYPAEPSEGIEIGEEFSYIINVYQGIMYLTFSSPGHDTKTFTKSLIDSDYKTSGDIPAQVLTVFSSTGQDGTEKTAAYSGELQYFKQGAYNQTNSKDPADNMIWNTGAKGYTGTIQEVIDAQYSEGNYTEVWFKAASVSAGTAQ